MRAYKYEYHAYTCNLCWGRIYLGSAPTREGAERLGRQAGRGVFVVEKKRVYID